MADLTFGESMSLLETQEYNPWLQGIFDQIFYACVSRAFQYFPLLWSIVQRSIPRSIHEMAEASVKFSADRVDKRLTMETERPDIFGLVLKHEAGSKVTRQEMHANADLLMIAGTETTATMLSGLTFNLLTSPDAMSRLTKEIRGTFKSGSDINSNALARLPVSQCPTFKNGKSLTIAVPLGLLRRRLANISLCRRRRAPQNQHRNRCHDLRPLYPTQCKSIHSTMSVQS
jgi:cytochrome P450